MLRCMCLSLLLAVAAADDCSSATSCSKCTAGCTWANKWDSTGWHCMQTSDVNHKTMLVTAYTDCDCAIDSDTG